MFNRDDRIVIQEIYAKLYAIDKRIEVIERKIDDMNKLKPTIDEKSPYMTEDGLYSVKEYIKKTNARKYGNIKEVVE